MSRSITVILNCYKRPEYLQEQLTAIRNQTIPPENVWLWVNATKENRKTPYHSLGFDKVIKSDTNCKYHARFALGLLADTEYVAFFDDDTIPGKEWFENCLDTMKKTPGILGGAGCVLQSRAYVQHIRMGWPALNDETMPVDLVGHAWFLRREDLNYMWREIPYTFENGEDIQLGYLAKKYGKVQCYCPPHPADKPELHSSLKAVQYGNDNKASSNGSLMTIPEFYQQRDMCISHAIEGGWNTVLGVK
jgi:glycosyltransferase involved in cell wall biosynthesis